MRTQPVRRTSPLMEKMAKIPSAKRRRHRLFPRKRRCSAWTTRQREHCGWQKTLNEQETLVACFAPWSTEKQPQDSLSRQTPAESDREWTRASLSPNRRCRRSLALLHRQ